MQKKHEGSTTAYIVLFSTMLAMTLYLTASSVERLYTRAGSMQIGQPMIVIDAGHGGEDGGTTANGLLEKDVNLSIAKTLQQLFLCQGYDVRMLREDDTALGDSALSTVRERKQSDLKCRVELVNDVGNCILISVHQNYFEQSQYSGAQAFYGLLDADSVSLAQSVQTAIQGHLQPENNREIKPGNGIYLLEKIQAPGIIIECGFLSNAEEAARLGQEEYQQEMALCIFDGVCVYLQQRAESEQAAMIFG